METQALKIATQEVFAARSRRCRAPGRQTEPWARSHLRNGSSTALLRTVLRRAGKAARELRYNSPQMSRRFTIGRDRDCDVPIADDSVSRRHAELWLSESGALMMADAGSSNGTTLIRGGRGFPLFTEAVSLTDRVRLGDVDLGIGELVDAVEIRHPGALTVPTPIPPAIPLPPPVPGYAPLTPAGLAGMIRCECGAYKNYGRACPVCGR